MPAFFAAVHLSRHILGMAAHRLLRCAAVAAMRLISEKQVQQPRAVPGTANTFSGDPQT